MERNRNITREVENRMNVKITLKVLKRFQFTVENKTRNILQSFEQLDPAERNLR